MIRFFIICLLSLSLLACAAGNIPPGEISELQQGKRYFDEGYYKRAMHELLPIACDGNPDAQYAVGYMYYYGLGVAQDTDVGHFWIQRAANRRYVPAIRALQMIEVNKERENRQLEYKPKPWSKTEKNKTR